MCRTCRELSILVADCDEQQISITSTAVEEENRDPTSTFPTFYGFHDTMLHWNIFCCSSLSDSVTLKKIFFVLVHFCNYFMLKLWVDHIFKISHTPDIFFHAFHKSTTRQPTTFLTHCHRFAYYYTKLLQHSIQQMAFWHQYAHALRQRHECVLISKEKCEGWSFGDATRSKQSVKDLNAKKKRSECLRYFWNNPKPVFHLKNVDVLICKTKIVSGSCFAVLDVT